MTRGAERRKFSSQVNSQKTGLKKSSPQTNRTCVLCSYYARGVALILVGLTLARLTGVVDNPAWLSNPATWAFSFYPFALAFFYLTMALLFGYTGFFYVTSETFACFSRG